MTQNKPTRISLEDALRIFRERYPSSDLEISSISSVPVPYGLSARDVWTIIFFKPDRILTLDGPVRTACISKSDGQIVYDGWAQDGG
jgi:hypothetical protein